LITVDECYILSTASHTVKGLKSESHEKIGDIWNVQWRGRKQRPSTTYEPKEDSKVLVLLLTLSSGSLDLSCPCTTARFSIFRDGQPLDPEHFGLQSVRAMQKGLKNVAVRDSDERAVLPVRCRAGECLGRWGCRSCN
jgi:hypothetical protein